MSMHEVAKHISAMGRNGDSMLVHMSPSEVKALHGIGSLTGSQMTVNPETGLPEAFSFGDFFKSLLPTIVGAVAAPFTGGGSLIPVLAGAATGAVLNKDNPLMGALTGGVGGFGGAGIGSALGKAAGAAQTAGTLGSAGTGGMGITATGGINPAYANAAGTALSEAALPTAAAQGTTTFFGPAAAATQTGGLGGLGQGIRALGTEAGRSAYTQALGGTGPNADLIAAGKTALPVGMAALTGIEPPALPEEAEDKYDPNSVLNLSGDTGLRFYAQGGMINETPDAGIGSLEDKARYGLASLNSNNNTVNYAEGGSAGLFSDKGGLNLGTGQTNIGGQFSPQQFEQLYNSYRADQSLTRSPFSPNFAFMGNQQNLQKIAEQRGVSARDLMRNPNLGLSEEQIRFNKMMQNANPVNLYNDPFRGFGNQRNLTPEQKEFNSMLEAYNKQGSQYIQSQLTPNELRKLNIGNTGMFGAAGLANRPNTSVSAYSKPLSIWANNEANYSPGLFGQQGLKLSKGGYLDGPGDGMSDSIPATIEGKQPARLADGEFVVAADVVSHLGNGSTKAGAERLYAMMDKVRKARTGTKKQGKQIKADKYLPA